MAQRRQTPREYVSGETHYVWGEQYFLDVQKQRVWGGILLSGDTMVMLAPEESTVRSRGECMQEWYRRILEGEIRLRLPLWERRTGIRVDRFDILNMNRSWGKCNPDKGKIVFNLQLARKPKEGLDYVILHELCHFRHRNHGKEFVALLDRFMPSWRQARAKLNEAPLDFVLEDALDPRGSAKKPAEQKRIARLADRILPAKTRDPEAAPAALESEIDTRVSPLDGLTSEEIAMGRGESAKGEH